MTDWFNITARLPRRFCHIVRLVCVMALPTPLIITVTQIILFFVVGIFNFVNGVCFPRFPGHICSNVVERGRVICGWFKERRGFCHDARSFLNAFPFCMLAFFIQHGCKYCCGEKTDGFLSAGKLGVVYVHNVSPVKQVRAWMQVLYPQIPSECFRESE